MTVTKLVIRVNSKMYVGKCGSRGTTERVAPAPHDLLSTWKRTQWLARESEKKNATFARTSHYVMLKGSSFALHIFYPKPQVLEKLKLLRN